MTINKPDKDVRRRERMLLVLRPAHVWLVLALTLAGLALIVVLAPQVLLAHPILPATIAGTVLLLSIVAILGFVGGRSTAHALAQAQKKEQALVREQEALQLAEARYRRLVQHLPVISYIAALDSMSSSLYVSPQIETLLGYSQDEWLTDPELWLKRIHPDDQARVTAQIADLQNSNVPVLAEFRMLARDGRVVWFRDEAQVVRGDDGQPLCVQGIMFDITDRKRSEQALCESERNLRLIAENTSDVIYAYDMNRRLLYVNAAFEALTGYTVAELRQRDFIPYNHPDDEARMMILFESTFHGESFVDVEYRIITRDGVVKWCSASGDPLLDDTGRQIGVQGRERDISARKQAQEERMEMERMLLETQKMESLGMLAGGIAHDFNNLLAIILGNASLALIDLLPDSPARDAIKQIEVAARRAAGLTQQMLTYAGKGRVMGQELDFNALISDMSALLQSSITKHAALKYRLAASLPALLADPAQLRQLVMNLLINASEAIGEHDGTITISTGVRQILGGDLSDAQVGVDAPVGEYVYLEIADTGAGMDAETLNRIFEPFFTTKFTGRGLGLAAALGIVRGHRGALKVRSAVGQGTTFTILLPAFGPRTGAHTVARDERPSETPLPPATTTPQRSGTILVVDDEESVRSAAMHMLQRWGFSVLAAADGISALEHLRAHADRIICVLLDLTMPHMDGEQALYEVRRIAPVVPVLLMSGNSREEVREQLGNVEQADFLQKPFDPATLRERLWHLLDAVG